ncbi:MAG: DUF1501 domain-containing protein [Isosphaeraceae bacterium]|nr:DUF1501 domain-containing protein [Isosphaeraceae bacterium]
MSRNPITKPHHGMQHPGCTRRTAVRAGAIGILGLGLGDLEGMRSLGSSSGSERPRARSVIFIFLSGGLSQIDSFDPKPDAPENIRGEFGSIATRTPGLRICEHLPLLAARSTDWSIVRSLSHGTNDHSAGHQFMLTGTSVLPIGFDPSRPRPEDDPSIAAVAGGLIAGRNNLPPAVVLPDRLIHNSGRVIPGQFAGTMGSARDPWFIEASPFNPKGYGAFPAFEFDHQERAGVPKRTAFQLPSLELPEGFGRSRLTTREALLDELDRRRDALAESEGPERFTREQKNAISLLSDPRVRRAFDVSDAPASQLDRYGRHSFGWSLLMARRLVESGVGLVQVNLGNNETWDTHGNAFPHLKEKLFPPTDQAVSALIDDLKMSGLLDETLVVMASEFGRTPKISHLPQHYTLPGRDHWGRVQTVWLCGGGIEGGRVVGSSDKIGGHPASDPQSPENFAATIYRSLGIPENAAWYDAVGRPHFVYKGDPFPGLT